MTLEKNRVVKNTTREYNRQETTTDKKLQTDKRLQQTRSYNRQENTTDKRIQQTRPKPTRHKER